MKEKISFKNFLVVFSIVVVFLGGFLIVNNYLKERNQIEREKLVQQKLENDRKFDASQKEACLAIYKQESSKWGNVTGWRYDEKEDDCFIQYKSSPAPTKADCDTKYKGEDGKVLPLLFIDWLLCQDGLFEKTF